MSYMARESGVKAAMSGEPQMVTASWHTTMIGKEAHLLTARVAHGFRDTGIGREIIIPAHTQTAALYRDYLLAGSGDHEPKHPGRLP